MYATKINNPFDFVKENLTISGALYVLDGRSAIPGKKTRCPSQDHTDEHPSCDIDRSDKVFHCKTCGVGGSVIELIGAWYGLNTKEKDDALEAAKMGYTMLGVDWPYPKIKSSSGSSGKSSNLTVVSNKATPKSAGKEGSKKDASKEKDKTLKELQKIDHDPKVEEHQQRCEAFYDYTDTDGNPLFRVFRLPGKEFRQTTWNGRCYVNCKAVDVPQVLYNAPALKNSDNCVIVEGEKDADALIKLGIVATTWAGGGGKGKLKNLLNTWDLFEPLRGKDVVWFAPDPDEAGEAAFEEAVPFINGFVDEFRKVKWPGEGIKDAHDFISQFEDADSAREAVWNVLYSAPEYVPPMDIENVLCRANRLKGLDIPPPAWIVEDLIPVGYTMVIGRSKVRKTMFLVNLAIAVAKGSIAIGKFPTTKGTVIYCSLEDDAGSWKSKLESMLGDESWPPNLLGCFDVERFPMLESKIIEWKKAFPDLNMVVLDNLALIKRIRKGPGSSDTYDNEYVEQNHFKKFARKLGIALVIVHHAGKNETGDITRDVLGTTAYAGAPDKLISVQRPVNEDQYNNILTFMNRNTRDQDRMALKFHSDTLTFNYVGPLENFEISEIQEQVLDLLAGRKKPMQPSEIARALGRQPGSATNKLLQRMLTKGLVKSPSRGLYQYVEPGVAANG